MIIGGGAVLIYGKKKGIAPIHAFDACAPAMFAAYGIGRLGCQFSGDGDWGINNLTPKPDWLSFLPDWVWSYQYPGNVIHAGIPIPGCEGSHCTMLEFPVWPTPLYEAVMALSLFAFLWSIRKKIVTPGVMTGIYLILNGIERFFIEKIRINENYHIGSLDITQAEIISVLFFLAGIACIWYFKRKPQKPVVS